MKPLFKRVFRLFFLFFNFLPFFRAGFFLCLSLGFFSFSFVSANADQKSNSASKAVVNADTKSKAVLNAVLKSKIKSRKSKAGRSVKSPADKLGYSFSNKTKNKTKKRLKAGGARGANFSGRRNKKKSKARGVIVKFHRWPASKQQKAIIRKLSARGLKKTRSIRSFNTWLFEWRKGGLKPSHKGEEACKGLKGLSVIKRCNPDILLPLSFSLPSKTRVRDTEAVFIEDCPSCRKDIKLPSIPLNIRTCNIVSYKQELMEGRLSDYWAQELIAADLLKEELSRMPAPKKKNWIAVFDSTPEDHNIYVKNLISDEGPHAVLPELAGGEFSFFETNFSGEYVMQVDSLLKSAPHFINNSMDWRRSRDIYEAFEKLSPKTILVMSSGNNYPQELGHMKSQASKDFDAILVGSFSPYGFVSYFSQSGEEVHIMAPSDEWITSAGSSGEYEKFGGTSGATPLVTGSLAGFEWMSGYHPTAKEAKILLEKTAIPTLHSHQKPQINGAGLVNAYKLGELGKRLKKKCKSKSVSCFRREILNEENYFFNESASLNSDLRKVFPSCAAGEVYSSGSISTCEQKKELFKKLRRSVLLNPQDGKDLMKSLSCIYREGGFFQNADMWDRLRLALGSEEEVRDNIRDLPEKIFNSNDSQLRASAVLAAGRIGESALPILELGAKDQDPRVRLAAVRVAGEIGEPALPILELGVKDPDADVREATMWATGEIGEPALPILELGVKDPDADVQWVAMWATVEIGESALPIVELGAKDKDPKLRVVAMEVTGRIGEKSALPILELGAKDQDVSVRRAAVKAAGRIGEPALPILELGAEDQDVSVRRAAVKAAGKIGEPALHILELGVKDPDVYVRRAVVKAAGRIGEPALPLLKKILEDNSLSPRIRTELKKAVSRIESGEY